MTAKKSEIQEVSKQEGVSAATGRVIDNLFGRSSKIIGEYSADKLEEYLNKKRSDNINMHHDAVEKQIPEDFEKDPTVRKIKLTRLWGEYACEFGPEEPELSAAWQVVLDGIISESKYAADILEAVKTLTFSEILLLRSLVKDTIELHSGQAQFVKVADNITRLRYNSLFDRGFIDYPSISTANSRATQDKVWCINMSSSLSPRQLQNNKNSQSVSIFGNNHAVILSPLGLHFIEKLDQYEKQIKGE